MDRPYLALGAWQKERKCRSCGAAFTARSAMAHWCKECQKARNVAAIARGAEKVKAKRRARLAGVKSA